jgi:PEP-CTERM motif
MMKYLLMSAAVLAALATPAHARLQLSIGVGASTFTCFDGQLSCDQSGGANNLLIVDQTVNGAFVQLALTQSQFGPVDELQLSTSNIENLTAAPLTVTLTASDTDYTFPVSAINNSASLTFNSNIGAPNSTLTFFADAANGQGAPGTPGTLLESVSGHATTDPDSFSGSRITAFDASAPFSMSEQAVLVLRANGSITGFNQSMESTSAIPEPSTWALMGLGFAAMAAFAWRRRAHETLAVQ